MISPEAIAEIIERLRIQGARWMKLNEACGYSKICKARLVELARAGRITGFQDPDNGRRHWIFDRQSIDEYRLSQSKVQEHLEEAARLLS